MTLDNVLIFDCETTGVIPKGAKWSEDYKDFPHIVSIAWMIGEKENYYVIQPTNWEIPEEATAVHGITTEFAKENGMNFVVVIDKFIQDCLDAELIAGHNIHFDTSIVKANIMRELGVEYYNANDCEEALFKGKRIDTMTPTMKWVDARTINGRLKFPKLIELYHRCFPGEDFDAHNALGDVKAVKRCLPKLLELGLIELKVKEYEDNPETPNKAQQTIFSDKVDSCTAEPEKSDCGAKSEEITNLLNQTDF